MSVSLSLYVKMKKKCFVSNNFPLGYSSPKKLTDLGIVGQELRPVLDLAELGASLADGLLGLGNLAGGAPAVALKKYHIIYYMYKSR